MDFVADALFDGRRLRTLPIIDNYTSECLAIDVGQSLNGEDGVRVLEQLRFTRGLPKAIKVDNGSEFISKAMDKWPMSMALNWTSPDLAGQPITQRSRRSMAASGRNV